MEANTVTTEPTTMTTEAKETQTITFSNQYVQAIIDRSGSMRGKTEDVKGGILEQVETLKKEKEEGATIFYSIKMFDNAQEMLLEYTSIDDLNETIIKNLLSAYVPRGTTAIRDALGASITHAIENKDKYKFDSCMLFVMTDGEENASNNPLYVPERLKLLIEEVESSNIKVFYVGSNQDACTQANNIGISAGHAMDYSENTENVAAVYRSLGSVAKRQRSGISTDFTPVERSMSLVQ